jgi:[lysine-biosynthesis-protein LysW]--L-2-aminoadipate ligase
MLMVRNLSHREAIGTARRFACAGIPTFNNDCAIERCADKGLQALLFAQHGVPHPISHHAFDHEQVRASVSAVGWPAVIKPLSASWGRGVALIPDEAALRAWAAGWEAADAAGKQFPVLVQQCVDKPGHDLRVLVVGAEPVVAIRRRGHEWRTNTHIGAGIEPVEITEPVRELCKQTVMVLGPGFYGVDLIEDRHTGALYVLEVNANPDFARSSAVHGVDVAGIVATHVVGVLATEPEAMPPRHHPNTDDSARRAAPNAWNRSIPPW